MYVTRTNCESDQTELNEWSFWGIPFLVCIAHCVSVFHGCTWHIPFNQKPEEKTVNPVHGTRDAPINTHTVTNTMVSCLALLWMKWIKEWMDGLESLSDWKSLFSVIQWVYVDQVFAVYQIWTILGFSCGIASIQLNGFGVMYKSNFVFLSKLTLYTLKSDRPLQR